MYDPVNEASADELQPGMCAYCREESGRHAEDCEGLRISGQPLREPPVVEEVPVLVYSNTPRETGPLPTWVCHTLIWRRRAIALVYPPGATRSLLTLIPTRPDLDTGAVGGWAVRLARQMVRLVNGEEADALVQIRVLLEEIRPTAGEAEYGMRQVAWWLRRYRRDPMVWPPLDL